MTSTGSDRIRTEMAAVFDERDTLALLRPLVRLVAEGDPVPVDRLAAAANLSVDEVEARLRAEPGVDWDDDGRLLGFGLTQRPTNHRFLLGDRVLYTFCAADTLIFPVMLGRAATVESICAATAVPIRLEVTPEAVIDLEPATAVVSQIRLCAGVTDIRANVCDHGHFYATASAAEGWRRDHADGDVVPVGEFFAKVRALSVSLRAANHEVDAQPELGVHVAARAQGHGGADQVVGGVLRDDAADVPEAP